MTGKSSGESGGDGAVRPAQAVVAPRILVKFARAR